MNTQKNQQISIGAAVTFRDARGKRQFMLVKQKAEGDWEIPKVTVRRGESSVRATLRLMGEQAGMSVKVLEEAGRVNGTVVVNSKSIPQKIYYYLVIQKSGGSEAIGFEDFEWLEYSQASKKVKSKREKEMLKNAREVLKEWEKTHNVKKQFVEEIV